MEGAVQVAERWILAGLRNRTFFSLIELNDAISALLERSNAKPFQKCTGSRASVFAEPDKPALKPLPAERYVFARWANVRAHVDYHVSVDKHNIRCRIGSPGSSLTCASRPPPSRCSTRASR